MGVITVNMSTFTEWFIRLTSVGVLFWIITHYRETNALIAGLSQSATQYVSGIANA